MGWRHFEARARRLSCSRLRMGRRTGCQTDACITPTVSEELLSARLGQPLIVACSGARLGKQCRRQRNKRLHTSYRSSSGRDAAFRPKRSPRSGEGAQRCAGEDRENHRTRWPTRRRWAGPWFTRSLRHDPRFSKVWRVHRFRTRSWRRRETAVRLSGSRRAWPAHEYSSHSVRGSKPR